jgi:hypothetical protein
MPVSSALRRLLRIRDLEQEQHQRALESALAELRQLERALEQAAARQRNGRTSFTASVRDRIPDLLLNPNQNSDQESYRKPLEIQSALVETTIGKRQALAIAPRISRAAAQVALRRKEFLLKRVELRQAETLIRDTEAADVIEAARQGQKALDDWYLSRTRSDRRDAVSPASPSEDSEDFSNLPTPE